MLTGKRRSIYIHTTYIPGGSLLATSGLSIGYSDPNVPLLSDGVTFSRAAISVGERVTVHCGVQTCAVEEMC